MAPSGRALLFALALCACSGTIEAPPGSSRSPNPSSEPNPNGPGHAATAGSGAPSMTPVDPGAPRDPAPPTDMPSACDPAAVDPGPSPMRLLTRAQYLRTVDDLLGTVDGLPAALGTTAEASAFGLKQPDISQVELEGFQNAADLIAGKVTSDAGRLRALVPCGNGDDPADCARRFVTAFGARAYRAPLTGAADIERHLALYRKGAETSHAHGVELVLRGVLQAPRFLYRVEVGTVQARGDRAVALSGHEIAARLSYLVTGGPPDPALTTAADEGHLSTPEGAADALAALLASERGAGLMREFLAGLLHVDAVERAVKDEAHHPEWGEPALRAALRDQSLRFFDHVLGDEGGALATLFTSRTVFTSRALSAYYGEDGSDDFRAQVRDDGTAAGILTLPALLAVLAKPDESSPIYRGKFVREVLLCQQLPAPPANIPKPPQVEPDESTRERLRQHESDPACSGCHRLLDPIGFGFEHFDAIGRYRTDDGGKPVDARGEIVESEDSDGTFEGVAELGARLARSAEVEQCIARQFFRYALGRFEQSVDACSMEQLLTAFRAAGQDLRALPRAVVATDAFLYRRPID